MEQLQKAFLVATYASGLMDFFEVQFNPTEFTLDKAAQISEITIPGLDSPLLQFVRGQNEKLTVDLFFDSTESGMGVEVKSVTELTDRVYQLIKIEPERHAPPICDFFWNSKFPGSDLTAQAGNQKRTSFQCVVESVKQKFTLFNPHGVPLRATITLTLREYKTLDEQLHQLNLTSPDRTHGHVVQQGETLSAIAARYYLKPSAWRAIAKDQRNNLEDPRRVESGQFLTIPPIAN